ncbi:MAG: hypothetical protein AAB393_19455, partial [Bacteroidota bacterium]
MYNQTTSLTLAAGSFPVTATFPVTSLGVSGTYTMRARTELPGDEDPSNDEMAGTFNVLAPLVGGTYQVGTGQPSPFNTLDGAINRLNVGGIAGPVTLQLTDGIYTLTIAPEIKDIPGNSLTNPVTIKPASGGLQPIATTITGNVLNALIKFTNAKNIIIDGSASGGTDRSLTIINTSTGSPTAGFWLSSTGAGGGCQN